MISVERRMNSEKRDVLNKLLHNFRILRGKIKKMQTNLSANCFSYLIMFYSCGIKPSFDMRLYSSIIYESAFSLGQPFKTVVSF